MPDAQQLSFPLGQFARTAARPFLKWAGGKRALLPRLLALAPAKFRNYHEPFLGGAALFWALMNRKRRGESDFGQAFLSDINEDLILVYQTVREHLSALLPLLQAHREKHSREHYYQTRAQKTDSLPSLERAARFIYLNKTCDNGLYRVNKAGQFNVPMGSYKNPRIFNPQELRAASEALQTAVLRCADFTTVLEYARPGDFIYFDPPYVPLSATSSFTSYTRNAFGLEEHEKLAEIFRLLDARGCKLMLSNSDTPYTRQLYNQYTCLTVQAPRAINTNPRGRGKIAELLALNYEPPLCCPNENPTGYSSESGAGVGEGNAFPYPNGTPARFFGTTRLGITRQESAHQVHRATENAAYVDTHGRRFSCFSRLRMHECAKAHPKAIPASTQAQRFFPIVSTATFRR